MKHPRFRRLLASLLVLVFCVSASAQWTLGPQRFIDAGARVIRDPTSLRTGAMSMRYLNRVGGVAFDQAASPAGGMRVNSLTLDYRSGLRDGRRLALTFDGRPVTAPIYDWQLIPIAKFANSPYYACFSLFGGPENDTGEQYNWFETDDSFSYHEAFLNTLLGVRLLQLDTLILDGYDSFDLMKNRGRYVLGAGERLPDVRANRVGKEAFEDFIDPLMPDFADLYDSYVISDLERRITFDDRGGTLNISGEPYYYFWRHDRSGKDDKEKVKPLTELSNKVSGRTDLLRRINPAVWDAGVQVMRYAAFFRYCKQNHPAQWQKFMAQIKRAPAPLPSVKTPGMEDF